MPAGHPSFKITTKPPIMKQQHISMSLAMVLVAGALSFTSCRKKEKENVEPTPDTEQTTATDNNLAENMVNDIATMGSQVSENGNLTTYRTAGESAMSGEDFKLAAACATVTGVGTKTITVDFGSSCLGLDGRTRSGKLIYDFSASSPTTAIYYRNPGFSMSVSSQNYVVDGHQVNIVNKKVTNTTPGNIPSGPNPGTNLTWSVTASVNIIKPNGGTISWSCNRTMELINTSNTNCYNGQTYPINWTKAMIQLNGTSNGTNANGENFTAVVTNVVKDFNCAPDPLRPRRHPFVSGTISYTPGTRPTRLINFGSSTCDFNATVTINGVTYTITLP